MPIFLDRRKRLQQFFLPDFHLEAGFGPRSAVRAAAWLAGDTDGERVSGKPARIALEIARYVQWLGDSPLFDDRYRDALKPYCLKITGTSIVDRTPLFTAPRYTGLNVRLQRSLLISDYTIHVFAPLWLRCDPERRFDEHALACKNAPQVTNQSSSLLAEAVLRRAAAAVKRCYRRTNMVALAEAFATQSDLLVKFEFDAPLWATISRSDIIAAHGKYLRDQCLELLTKLCEIKTPDVEALT